MWDDIDPFIFQNPTFAAQRNVDYREARERAGSG